MPHYDNSIRALTVKSTKYFWLFSPTQLLTQGQWWSIFRMQRLQTLQVDKVEDMGEHSNPNAAEWNLQQQEYTVGQSLQTLPPLQRWHTCSGALGPA